jgi:hypothetical protein
MIPGLSISGGWQRNGFAGPQELKSVRGHPLVVRKMMCTLDP